MKINWKKKNIILFIILIISAITITVSFAYFLYDYTTDARTIAEIDSDRLEHLLLVSDKPLAIHATMQNFSLGNGSLSDTAIATATLNASTVLGTASQYYHVYLDITKNTFEYSVDVEKPEILLKIIDHNEDIITSNIDMEYVTVTDVDGVEQSGFNITNQTGIFEIREYQEIKALNSTDDVTQSWEFEIIFVNYDADQSKNLGKEFEAEIRLQTSMEKFNLASRILENEGGTTYIKSKGTPNFNTVATTNMGMYSTSDNYGTSYYFRGAVDDNWVKFANRYWRIVRINGDGSIRLTHAGNVAPTESQKVTLSWATVNIGSRSFYNHQSVMSITTVGYMSGSPSYYGYTSSSPTKTVVDNWYTSNLISYASYMSDTLYCGDRTPYSGNGQNRDTLYGGYNRLGTNKTPSLVCPNRYDRYTVSDTSRGNGGLTYPIGIISADELAMAGMHIQYTNSNVYIYSGGTMWTMTPYRYTLSASQPYIFVYSSRLASKRTAYSTETAYIVPVINLKTTVAATGRGLWDDPYVINGFM